MAKTNWQLNEIVLPADMNQIGTEINEKATKVNPELSGIFKFENQILRRRLGIRNPMASSPNQKVNIILPNVNYNGLIFLEIFGNSGSATNLGKITKVFTGLINGTNLTFNGTSKYEEIYSISEGVNSAHSSIQIGEITLNSGNLVIPVSYSSNLVNVLTFSVKLETASTVSTVKTFLEGITLGDFYPDTEVFPKAYEQKDRLQLTAQQGTAPLIVTSTTRVDNFNADYHNGLKRYNSITDLSLTIGDEDASSIFTSMSANSELTYRKPSSNTSNFYPENYGLLKVYKKDDSASDFEFLRQEGSGLIKFYKASYRSDVTPNFSGWKQVSFNGSPISSTQLISTATQGTAPIVVSSTTKVNNLNADLLDGYDSDVNVSNNTIPVRTGNGSLNVNQLTSTASQGTAPLVVSSTTKVDNLNVDMLNGFKIYNSFAELGLTNNATIQDVITAMSSSKIILLSAVNAVNNSNLDLSGRFGLLSIRNISLDRIEIIFYDNNGTISVGKFNSNGRVFNGWNNVAINGDSITGYQITSTANQGVSPLLVSSTTKVNNLNSDLLDGYDTNFSTSVNTIPVRTANGSINVNQLISTATQGTAPLVVTSTTRVNNLNADYVNGNRFYNNITDLGITPSTETAEMIFNAMADDSHLSYRKPSSNTSGFYPESYGLLVVYKKNIFASNFEFYSQQPNGILKIYKASYRSDITPQWTGWKQIFLEGTNISGTQLTSTAPQGTAPLVVTSTSKVNNLNADLLDDMHASSSKTANTVVSRKSDGGIEAGGFSLFEQMGVKLPGRNRELRLTQGSDNISYIQLVNDAGTFIANPIQINTDGTSAFNSSTRINSYSNTTTPQVRNTHVGETTPSNSLGLNGDVYIEI